MHRSNPTIFVFQAPATSFCITLVPDTSIKPQFFGSLQTCTSRCWEVVVLGRWGVPKFPLAFLCTEPECCFPACWWETQKVICAFVGAAVPRPPLLPEWISRFGSKELFSFCCRLKCFLEKLFTGENKTNLDEWAHAGEGLQWSESRSCQMKQIGGDAPS